MRLGGSEFWAGIVHMTPHRLSRPTP